MTPLSNDPAARQRQLQNLRRGGTVGPGRPPEHGGFAAVRREQLAEREREVLDVLAESAPVRDADDRVPAADGVVVTLLAETLCRLATVKAAIDAWPWGDRRGNYSNALAIEARLSGHCLRLCEQLGMTPMARRRLGLPVAPEQPPTPDPDDEAERRAALARLEADDEETT